LIDLLTKAVAVRNKEQIRDQQSPSSSKSNTNTILQKRKATISGKPLIMFGRDPFY
jgi:hypothetical protein